MKMTKKEITALVTAIAERITGEEEKVFPAISSYGRTSVRVLDQNGLRAAIRRALRHYGIEASDMPIITAVTINPPIRVADLLLER
jgi:hypothetical protein